MSKRKLSKQQAWRIEKIQQEKAARAAKKASKIDSNHSALGDEIEGLVTAHYGTQVSVEALGDEHTDKTPSRCHFRANLGSLVTGDKVIWQRGEPYGVVVAVLPRKTELARPDPYTQTKVIAANIDHMLIVIAPLPKPHTQLIDRYLVAAESAGITPILVINKTDLITDDNQAMMAEITSLYQQLDYRVIEASAVKHQGLEDLQAQLSDNISIFVGQSGVGKSSLINMLIPDLDLQVGAISDYNQKGTHTTTLSQLFHFSKGGQLIDSPGIRELGVWHFDEKTIIEGFKELEPFIGYCKFRDCKHDNEPGCAILQAYDDGNISDFRMASFRALVDEVRSGGVG